MPFTTSQVITSSTATLLYTATAAVEVRIKLINGDGYFGPDSSLTISNGYYMAGASGGEQRLSLSAGDTVYGIGLNTAFNILAIS